MIRLTKIYRGRCFGFDWLGQELADRPIPADWWAKRSPIKQLERELDVDALARSTGRMAAAERLGALSEQQDRILTDATVRSLGDRRYDRITADYYATLRSFVAGTRFAPLAAYYRARDARIAHNVAAAARAHRGDRIAIVTGADHHGPVIASLARHPARIEVVPVV
jgi:hypothetical protein